MAASGTSCGDTPAFDELFDCARRLGSCDVLIEHAPSVAGMALAVVVRRRSDGAIVHRAEVSSGIEEAAARICAGLRRSRAG